MPIRFEWKGKTYEIPDGAYDVVEPVAVVLSASEAVRIFSWKETRPPKPDKIESVPLSPNVQLRSPMALKMLIGAHYIAKEIPGPESGENAVYNRV